MTLAALLLAWPLAQEPLPVLLLAPTPTVPSVAIAVTEAVGATARVQVMTPAELLAAPPASAVLLGAPELLLQRLARQGKLGRLPAAAPALPPRCLDAAGRYVLPFALRYVIAQRVDAAAGTFEALALDGALHDRLGLVPPEVDAMPWLFAMAGRAARGEDEVGGYALWTTLDARAGTYQTSYAALVEGLDDGRLLAAVLPEPFALAVTGSEVVAATRFSDGVTMSLLGIAVLGDSEAARATTDRLLAPPAVAALAGALGAQSIAADPANAAVPAWVPELTDRWLSHFEQQIRGRGRAVESVADGLDLVFGIAFAVFVLIAWLYLRRSERHGPVSE